MVRRGGAAITIWQVWAALISFQHACQLCWPLLRANQHLLGREYLTLEFTMNIELDEVAVLDVSDDALELAAGGAQGGCVHTGFGDFTWA